jgi:hypothetical protein
MIGGKVQRWRIDKTGGVPVLNRLGHGRFIGRQEQVDMMGRQVWRSRSAPGEREQFNIQSMLCDRVRYPQSGVGGVLGQQANTDNLLPDALVKPKEGFDKWKARTGLKRNILVFELVSGVFLLASRAENLIFAAQFKEGARRHGYS